MIQVEQGKRNTEKIDTHTAVLIFQPNAAKRDAIDVTDISALTNPPPVYIITAMGMTISFAGKPSKKESNRTPSIPISLPTGSNTDAA